MNALATLAITMHHSHTMLAASARPTLSRRPRRLALASATPPAAPPLKVAVVGAGVGGLTSSLALTRLLRDRVAVSLFEKTTSEQWEAAAKNASPAGANLGLAGGAAVLHDLGLGEQLRAIGHPMNRMLMRTTAWKTLVDVPLQRLVAEGRYSSKALSRQGQSVIVIVMRAELVAFLAAALDASAVDFRLGSRVAGLSQGRLVLQDGSQAGPFDLIVAADGIRSTLREVTDASPPTASDTPPAKFSGLRVTYAVAPEERT